MGHHGDVEYDVMLLTVHRSQIRRLESNRQVKPFLLHRFVPGMYGVDRTRMDELNAILSENGFSPAPRVRLYPDDPQQVDARSRLLEMVIGARGAPGPCRADPRCRQPPRAPRPGAWLRGGPPAKAQAG